MRKMLLHEISNFVWANGGGRRTICDRREKLSWRKVRSKRTSKTPLGTWLSGARNGSLWVCCAGLSAGKQKSEISGNRRRPMPSSGRKTVELLEDEKEEPAKKLRNEYIDLGFDLGEREEQVACLASAALVLAMTDEARQETEM